MAFALAAGDLCSPAAVGQFGSKTEPPLLGVVTQIAPATSGTVIVWQDGREVTYQPSTGGSVDLGLTRFIPDLSPTGPGKFVNKKVRPNGTIPFPNIDARAEGVCVLAGTAEGFGVIPGVTTTPADYSIAVAIVHFNNGLYVTVPASGIEIVPGA